MDKVTAYLVLDIVLTPIFDQSINQIMELNNSKSMWVKADIRVENGVPIFPTFASSALCPFVISEDGTILKCSYDTRLVGITCYTHDFDLLKQGIAIDSSNWDWQVLSDKRRVFHIINNTYKSFQRFKQCYLQYPRDNSMLRLLMKDAELEI